MINIIWYADLVFLYLFIGYWAVACVMVIEEDYESGTAGACFSTLLWPVLLIGYGLMIAGEGISALWKKVSWDPWGWLKKRRKYPEYGLSTYVCRYCMAMFPSRDDYHDHLDCCLTRAGLSQEASSQAPRNRLPRN